MIFNYKDWTSYVNWGIIVFAIFEYIIYWDTMIRWKWGYWSIDLIPIQIILVLWYMVYQTIRINRLNNDVWKLEQFVKHYKNEN